MTHDGEPRTPMTLPGVPYVVQVPTADVEQRVAVGWRKVRTGRRTDTGAVPTQGTTPTQSTPPAAGSVR